MGNASFAFMISSTATDVVGKPFIIHDNAGGRVSCGMLMEAENAPAASGLTTTVEPQDASLSTWASMSSTKSLGTTAEPEDAVLSTASSMSSTKSLRTTAEPQDAVLSTASNMSSTNSLRTTAEPQDAVLSTATSISSIKIIGVTLMLSCLFQ